MWSQVTRVCLKPRAVMNNVQVCEFIRSENCIAIPAQYIRVNCCQHAFISARDYKKETVGQTVAAMRGEQQGESFLCAYPVSVLLLFLLLPPQ